MHDEPFDLETDPQPDPPGTCPRCGEPTARIWVHWNDPKQSGEYHVRCFFADLNDSNVDRLHGRRVRQ